MVSFDEQMTLHQTQWRRTHITSDARGYQNGRPYEWILPADLWEQGLWPGIRDGSGHPLSSYLKRLAIQRHSGAHNLKSSWVLCANQFFPFGASAEGRALLAGFLREHVDPAIHSVEGIELEYAEQGNLHPSILLGEEGGRRGAAQTSPDIAFIVNGGRGIVLTEIKFLEHSFYRCSAHGANGSAARPGNPDPARCDHVQALLADPVAQCHQATWGRKYLAHLAPVANRAAWSRLTCCPAARAGYQLVRQQALAEGMAASGKYDLVVSCVASDARNDTLRRCLAGTGLEDIRAWGDLFVGKARFASFTHQQWVAWVRAHDAERRWADWLDYVASRYSYTL